MWFLDYLRTSHNFSWESDFRVLYLDMCCIVRICSCLSCSCRLCLLVLTIGSNPTSGNYLYLLGALSVLTSPVTNAFGSGCVSSVDMPTSKNIVVQDSFVLVVLAAFRVFIMVFSFHFCFKTWGKVYVQRSGGIFYQIFSLGGDRKDKDLVTFGFLKFISILRIYALSRFRLQVQNKGEGAWCFSF